MTEPVTVNHPIDPGVQPPIGEMTARWSILWQTMLCTAPASLFIFTGQLFFAVLVFYGGLALLTGYCLLRHRIIHLTALLIGCIPMLMLLRPVFYHNSISVIFAGILLLWAIFRPSDIKHLIRDPLVSGLCLFAFAYWWYSVLATEFYATNLRIFELALGTAVIFLLSRFRSYLTPALLAIGSTTAFIVAGIWRYGSDRLGLVEVGSQKLGHPQQVGMACSLILILCLADRGRWLNLRNAAMRYTVAAAAAAVLLLTTSRTSWLLALAGLAALALARGQRRYIAVSALLLAAVASGMLATDRGEVIRKYVDKVVSSKRTLTQRTSGRYDMYLAFPELFWQSPVLGLGPGASENVYRSKDGTPLVMHSLFLHAGVELGILGLCLLLVMYAAFVRRAWIHRRLTGEVVPLAFAFACCVDALAHNSFNPLTGTFLGLALTDLSRVRIRRSLGFGSLKALRRGAEDLAVARPMPSLPYADAGTE